MDNRIKVKLRSPRKEWVSQNHQAKLLTVRRQVWRWATLLRSVLYLPIGPVQDSFTLGKKVIEVASHCLAKTQTATMKLRNADWHSIQEHFHGVPTWTIGLFTLVAYALYKMLLIGHRDKRMPPGPPTLPLLGNLHQIPITGMYKK
jgi:hypothetical protein